MSFLDQLVQANVIAEDETDRLRSVAEEKYDGSIDRALAGEYSVTPQQVLKLKGDYYDLPTRSVDPEQLDSDILKYIPEDSAKHYQVVPIGMEDEVLHIGVTEPGNIDAMDALRFITSKEDIPYKVFLITPEDFDAVYEKYQGLSTEVNQALSELDEEISKVGDVEVESTRVQDDLKPGEEERIVEDAPIIKIVAVILHHATEGNASDIHIENTGEQVKVRFRVDGVLHTSLVLPLSVYSGVVARIKILAKMRLDEKRKPQDSSFSARIKGGRRVDFRVSTFPTYYGEKVVMRILDSSKGIKTLEDLGLSDRNKDMVIDTLREPYGMILITGPTGSGKTTTLYSMLNALDRERQNVVSLEDPVEYQVEGVSQSQVMPEIGYTFASGLRSVLRQDPDILMVGEIRDKETAQLAIQAALTGHLVFSTLHTNNSIGVVPRLVDMGIDPYLIAPTLKLAVAQRLVRTLCPSAKEEQPMTDRFRSMMEEQFADMPEQYKSDILTRDTLYKAGSSAECPSGTRGRTAVFEMYQVDKAVKNAILTNPNENDIYQVARKQQGMLTLREDAIEKATRGVIPFEDVYNV